MVLFISILLGCVVLSAWLTALDIGHGNSNPTVSYRELYANEHESLDERSLDAWNHELDYCDICKSKSLAWKNFKTAVLTANEVRTAHTHDRVDITSDESHIPIKVHCMTCGAYGSIHTHGRGVSSDPQVICS